MTKKFDILKIFFIGMILVSVLVLAGCTEDNTDSNNDQDTGDADTGGSSNDYSGNHDPRLIGNWTWTDGTNQGNPVDYITRGWVNFMQDGTFKSFYDYGYTTVNYEGTWQAKDGDLYWGTNGHEISDWYSTDNYQIDGKLTIDNSATEMNYEKL